MDEARTDSSDGPLIASFRLGDGLFGIDTERIQEVVRVGEITPVHRAPDFIVGVINLRGRIVTIVDLGARLELAPAAKTPDGRILIVDWNGEHVGLLVEEVRDVLPAGRETTFPPPGNVRGVQGHFVSGVLSRGEHLVAVLDVDAVLSDREGDR